MPGSFDGLRISMRGINVSSKQMEVTSNNISQASNENYTRQEARLVSLGDVFDGEIFLGQGVEVSEVIRVRDGLLDDQIREVTSSSGYYSTKAEWLSRIESVYNEPSDFGVKKTLTNFWDAWSELANDPEGLGSRSNVLSRGETLSHTIQNLSSSLTSIKQSLDQELEVTVGRVNQLLSELAELNNGIFEKEAGAQQKANSLRDNRDAVLDQLSDVIDIRYREENNGMVTVLFGDRPAVWINSHEGIKIVKDPLNIKDPKLLWENGGQPVEVPGGGLKALLDLRKEILPGYETELDDFTNLLMDSVNEVYANGVGLESYKELRSGLGLDTLGLENNDSSVGQALGLQKTLSDGSVSTFTGEIHISFYDESNNVLRTNAVLVQPDDSLNDIIDQLGIISGLSASPVTDSFGVQKLQIQFEKSSSRANEVGFAISNNTGGFDTSGFLGLMGFSPDAKSTNANTVAAVDDGTDNFGLSSSNLEPLKNKYGNPDLDDILTTQNLGLQGAFTLNSFLSLNEGSDWHHKLQLRVNVETTDTVNSIMSKVNDQYAAYGFNMEFNDTTNKIELSNNAKFDSLGNYVTKKTFTTGAPDETWILKSGEYQQTTAIDYATLNTVSPNFMRISFANDYLYPEVPTDAPPEGYNGLGDNTGLFNKLHLNTLFAGAGASDMSIDSRIQSAEAIHSGYKLSTGGNQMALDLNSLQFSQIAGGNNFTIGEDYDNIISSLGVDVQKTDNLNSNEQLVLENFKAERQSISGVNLDEELTNMIMFQRVYEANARMLATISQMLEELIKS